MTLSVYYRLLSPLDTLLGSTGAALENLSVGELETGTLAWVRDESKLYYLDKTSLAVVSPPTIIATSRGAGVPGRWIVASSGTSGTTGPTGPTGAFTPPGGTGAMFFNDGGGGAAATSFTTDGSSLTGLSMLDGVTVVDGIRGNDLTDGDTTLLIADGTVREMQAGTLTGNHTATFDLTGAELYDVVSIRRFDVSGFTYTVRDSTGATLYVFPGDGICRIADFEMDGVDFVPTGVFRIAAPS